jgi:type IV pilus assembly protein PilM
MLNAKTFLALDFGAANLKLAEFEISESGGLCLRQYTLRPLGQDGAQEATRDPALQRALQEALAEKPYGARRVNVCAPGFHTFSKFVKLPPVDTSKVTQIIQYEAQQNVPFPLEDVVWDYQILGAAPSGELEVLLVAVKTDLVERLFRLTEAAGLSMQLVDVSPAALSNAFRYNYGDLEGCTMLLDIGAKTSNLLFFEKGNVYSRGINIGANSITQDFAKEARLTFDDAEKIKLEEGFVSLGGAYEEPDNPHAAAISKIARQVMTRLHIQVNQTLQYYRGQQGGSAPARLFLSGGAAIMPYTRQFFEEKLSLPEGVDYFNPFKNVQIDPALNLEELAKVAHSMGEVVGLGLRNLARCPVELNLMPKTSLKRQQLKQKQPFFLASVGCLLLILFAFGWFYNGRAKDKREALGRLTAKLSPLQRHQQDLAAATNGLWSAELDLDQYTAWMEDRFYWARICAALRNILLQVETAKEKELNAKVGLWIERFTPILPSGTLMNMPAGAMVTVLAPTPEAAGVAAAPGAPPSPPPPGAPSPGGPVPRKPAFGKGPRADRASAGGEIDSVKLVCRGVNMSKVAADANTKLSYAVANAFAGNTNLFDTGTELVGQINADGELTFTFEVMLKLKRPMKL